MNEIIKLGEKTYYIPNQTNIGIYCENDKDIWLIDTGNDKEAGKKILKLIEEKGWKVKGIINTHSNADHIGGDKIIVDKTNAIVLNNGIENCFTKYPILETSFLYGGFPFKDLTHKFLMASKPSNCAEICNNLPDGLEIINLPGHFFDQIGIKTNDEVYFLGDSLFSKDIISKYSLFFIYDVDNYLKSLNTIETLNGNYFVPSHAPLQNDPKELVKINKTKIEEICNYLLKTCVKPLTFEQILQNVFNHYNLIMTPEQYILIGSTIRSYLSYLYNQDKLTYYFENNLMFWKNNL
jgi:glyoxylase-like metal-dependent hydrolase (beta-lactamase superfamily II)